MSTAVTECPFKSHKELGLNKREWEALIKTLLLMEADAIVHVPNRHYCNTEFSNRPLFNMNDWNEQYTCGTVACIGGSAEIFGKLPYNTMGEAAERIMDEHNDHNLHKLFYRWVGDPTPRQAAQVLRGYLTTGETNWSNAKG